MLSPIDWYDKSLSRDNEHDTMQLDIWRWLKGQLVPDGYTRELVFEIPVVPLVGVGSGSLEVPAFADLAELYEPTGDQEPRYILYVMKPRILTLSGIVRQCRALEHAVTEMYRTTLTPGPTDTRVSKPTTPPNLNIYAIVGSGDYRISDLKELFPTLIWNTASKTLEGDRFANAQVSTAGR